MVFMKQCHKQYITINTQGYDFGSFYNQFKVVETSTFDISRKVRLVSPQTLEKASNVGNCVNERPIHARKDCQSIEEP